MSENTMNVEKVKNELENGDISERKRRVLELMLEDRELLDALA